MGTGSQTQIKGLPFTSLNIGNVQTGNISYFNSIASAVYSIGTYVENNLASMQLVGTTSQTVSVVNGLATFQNTTIVYGSASYFASF